MANRDSTSVAIRVAPAFEAVTDPRLHLAAPLLQSASMSGAPKYTAEDKSILLPYYKRFLVDPVLPFIPKSVDPNWITHVGHLFCLASAGLLTWLRPSRGVAMLVAMLLLKLYLWCDNADGAHARRTSQCSTTGEYLDHGLDVLNTAYIGVISAVAIGTTGTSTVIITALVAGAAVVTCWEQAETGVFRLGMLNQIESVTLVSILMVASAFWSTDVMTRLHVGPITLRLAILVWSCATILFGMGRAMLRVHRHGSSVQPPLSLLAFLGLVIGATWIGRLPTTPAVAICIAANVAFGFRMLTARLRSERPRFAASLHVAIAAIGGLVALGAVGARAAVSSLTIARALTGLVCVMFFVLAARDARETVQRLRRLV